MKEITLDTLNDLLQKTYNFDDAGHRGQNYFTALDALHEEARPISDALAAMGQWYKNKANDLLHQNTDGMQMVIEDVAKRMGLI